MPQQTPSGHVLKWLMATAIFVALVAVAVGGVWKRAYSPGEEVRDPVRRIDDLDNVESRVFALGSVWAVTSNRPDTFSAPTIEATVVRIDPMTHRVEKVLDSPGTEPTFVELDDQLWVKLVDRIVALDAAGLEVASIPLDPDTAGDFVAGNHHLWVLDFNGARVSVIDPRTAAIVRSIETGVSPVRPISAFGHVWIPSVTDGTVTIIDEETFGATVVVAPFVSSNLLTDATAVPGGLTGDEVWVTDLDGELFAITAEGEMFGHVRRLDIETPINQIHVYDGRAFLLPVSGLDVLVLDLGTGEILERIRAASIPFRAVIADDLVWVAGDGTGETLTVIDPATLDVRQTFTIGSNESNTTGPQQPLHVDGEIWVPNRGDGAIFIVDSQ